MTRLFRTHLLSSYSPKAATLRSIVCRCPSPFSTTAADPRTIVVSISAARSILSSFLKRPISTAVQVNRAQSTKISLSRLNCGSYSTSCWTPPLKISCIADEILSHRACGCGARVCSCDKHHWLAIMKISGAEFATEKALFNHYITTLASVVGSKEEAKQRIYLVSCGWRFGFGAEIDIETKYKLEVCPSVAAVVEDYHYQSRNKDPGAGSLNQFIPINWNHRLNDIFSYHHFSKWKLMEKSNHWLIHIKEPDGGFNSEQETIEFCTRMLANVLGSDKEAKEKIYIIWCKVPFGFGAEIDEEALDKLRTGPDVLTVLQDYAFDVKNKDRGVLVISPLSRSQSRTRFFKNTLEEEMDSKDLEDEKYIDEIIDSSDSEDFEAIEAFSDSDDSEDVKDSENAEDMKDSENAEDIKDSENLFYFSFPPDEEPVGESCCQHWFITVEKPVSEFVSMQQMIDYYIKTLARVVGSEKNAKGKIYRITCKENLYGFGAEIDEETSNKLKDVSGVQAVFPEFFFSKDHKGGGLLKDGQSVESFERTIGSLKMDLSEWRVEFTCGQADAIKQSMENTSA